MKNLIAFTIILLILQGCATSYQKTGFTGGYSETQLDENVFNVAFRGNGYTSRKRVADFTLLRSAELTLENGFQYFAIIDAKNYTSHSTYKTPTTSRTTGSAYSSGNYTYGNATTITTGGQTYNISKPSSSNTIVCFKEKPESIFTYNAKFIYKSIRQGYNIRNAETLNIDELSAEQMPATEEIKENEQVPPNLTDINLKEKHFDREIVGEISKLTGSYAIVEMNSNKHEVLEGAKLYVYDSQLLFDPETLKICDVTVVRVRPSFIAVKLIVNKNKDLLEVGQLVIAPK